MYTLFIAIAMCRQNPPQNCNLLNINGLHTAMHSKLTTIPPLCPPECIQCLFATMCSGGRVSAEAVLLGMPNLILECCLAVVKHACQESHFSSLHQKRMW